ncbi:hypothetical protein Psi02_79350 [Planotetraspora silvatica]|uniref:DUF5753 domain-containing protein n=1 Tax=Planotetraspora silvatica TaxID=234614 RepID=A0A8J3UXX7_9ACTN|nr:Scr1 family TA system antitoxin-like transcriptional regulator [Planotetraspora silvatica]GII51511.1 hypothetical protein Psi02_79350 [Planotetraspora silvatica]
MAAQLLHLAEAAQASNVSVRVIPDEVGLHAGMAGAFTILDFLVDPEDLDGLGSPSVIYVESVSRSEVLDSCDEVAQYETIYDLVQASALGEEATIQFLTARAASLLAQ